ncbi:MAG: hypothetical protein Q9208_006700 [Pyrenodesmia sp. 3 TL-2023]
MTSCNKCTRTFSTTLALQDHQRDTGHIDSPKSPIPHPASHKCPHCITTFPHKAQLTNHNQSCHRHICRICQKQFPESESLQQHQRSLKHYLHCALCDRPFANAQDLDEHRRASHMQACDACSELFENSKDLHAHQHARGHCYCRECDQAFEDQVAYHQHMRSKIHVSQYRCVDCKKDFVSEQALTQHLEDKVHKPALDPVIDHGPYSCSKCNHRNFRRQEDLQNHLQSLAHKPLSNLKCMLSSKCSATFKSPSGLIQHLESGACHSGMNKASLDQLILQHDVSNEITMGLEKLSLAAPPAVNRPSPWPPTALNLLPPNPRGAMRNLTPQTSPFTFANQAHKESFIKTALPITNSKSQLTCPLCPNRTRTFPSIQAFRNHIESPAHDPKVYHCPVNVLPPPPTHNNNNNNGKEETDVLIKEFSAPSALTQHVESGACKGGRKMLEVAIGSVEQRLKELGFKGVRLLK